MLMTADASAMQDTTKPYFESGWRATKLTFDPVHRSYKKPTTENLFIAIVCC
jgi:hypothetical protein